MLTTVQPRRRILEDLTRRCLADISSFSRLVLKRPLRPHQRIAANGILPHIRGTLNDPTFVVMMSRQAGKNELSAHIEAYLLNREQKRGGQIVKAAPTFKPQIVTSMERLQLILDNWWNKGKWKPKFVYMTTLGRAKVIFFSADKNANIVGATADVLLEIDEAQDVDETKYNKDLAPMVATTNAVRIFYGTAWTKNTLLAKMERSARQSELRDGVKRVFKFDWETVAHLDEQEAWEKSGKPARFTFTSPYRRFVEGEIAKHGLDHPIIKTQYRLIEIDEEGKFLTEAQIKLLQGYHFRMKRPSMPLRKFTYVAGIDYGGESEIEKDDLLRLSKPKKDSTVITIARINYGTHTDEFPYPRMEIVDHYWWTGRNHRVIYEDIVGILKTWGVSRAVSDATGVGAGVTSFLLDRFGGTIEAFDFTARSKSELGYALLSAINTERIKMYREDTDEQSDEAREFWFEMNEADYEMRANQTMSFYVPEDIGHDDFLMSLALCAWAGKDYAMTPETGTFDLYRGGR